MRTGLAKIVAHAASDPTLREDLFQEAVIHLWHDETRRPNQTRSWYLQSCKFHVRHCLAQGRSVDALKRRGNGAITYNTPQPDATGVNETAPAFEEDNAFIARISAREIFRMAFARLSPRGRAVLECLADGLGVRAAARELKIAHTAVIKHRRAIAALLLEMGIAPPVQRNGHNGHANGNGAVQ